MLTVLSADVGEVFDKTAFMEKVWERILFSGCPSSMVTEILAIPTAFFKGLKRSSPVF